MKHVITLVLAGGVGSRLEPLTAHRSKPAVEFGGKYRIIDFVMSNCHHSGLRRVMTLVQHKAQDLIDYLQDHWSSASRFDSMHIVPPQRLTGDAWYRGTADAVYQNLSLIRRRGTFETVSILSGDHVFAMDFSEMFEYHKRKEATFTVCAIPFPTSEASRFGILEVDAEWRIVGFEEKPEHPKEIPGRPGWSLVSMGNYFAEFEPLARALEEDAHRHGSKHDFGKDIIPRMVCAGEAIYAYDFQGNTIAQRNKGYWRDVGTVGSYFDANMDLIRISPDLNVYDVDWPILTPADNLPSAKFPETKPPGNMVRNSSVSGGCIVQDSKLIDTVMGRRSRVYGACFDGVVMLSGSVVMNGCQIRRTIIEGGNCIPEGTQIGCDLAADEALGLAVDKESGIVIVPEGFFLA